MDVNRRVLIIDNDPDFLWLATILLLEKKFPTWAILIGEDDAALRSPDLAMLAFMARSDVPLRSDRQSGRISRSMNTFTVGRSRSLDRVVAAVREFQPGTIVIDHFFGEVGFSGIDIVQATHLENVSLIGTCTTEKQLYCGCVFDQKRDFSLLIDSSRKAFLALFR